MFLLKLNMSLVDSAHLLTSTEINFVLLKSSSSWPSLKTCMFWKIKYLTWSDVPHVFPQTRNGRPWSTRSYPRSTSAPYWAGIRLVARRGRAVSAHIPRWSVTASAPARAPSLAEARSVRTYANTGDVCKTETKYVLTMLGTTHVSVFRAARSGVDLEMARPVGPQRNPAQVAGVAVIGQNPKKPDGSPSLGRSLSPKNSWPLPLLSTGMVGVFPTQTVFAVREYSASDYDRARRQYGRNVTGFGTLAQSSWYGPHAPNRSVEKLKNKPTISKQAIVSAFYRQIDWAMHARRRKCACRVVARKRPARQSIKGHWTTCTDRAPTNARRTKARLK